MGLYTAGKEENFSLPQKNSRASMRMTVTMKFVATLALSLIFCCGAVLGTAIYYLKQPLQVELTANIARAQNMVHVTNEATSKKFADIAAIIAKADGLPEAVALGEYDSLRPLIVKLMKEAGSDFMTVTDSKGIVLGRGHSPKYKDDVTNQETVLMALKGTPSVCMVSGTEVPFSLRASHPVILNGHLVGTLSIGISLVSPAYLDWLKDMSGTEVTIFKKDTRAMTTIKDAQGERVLGTKMQTPEVIQNVLQGGQLYLTENNILGTHYKSAYWPVRDLNDNIVGMWFVGSPISSLMAQEVKAINITLMVTAGLMILLLALVTLAGMVVTAPIKRLARYAEEVASGQQDAVLDVHSNDDIGSLAEVLRTMVTRLKEQTLWYQGILDSIPISVSVTDMNMHWQFVNKAALAVIGKEKLSDVIGKHCSEKQGSLCNTPNCGIESLQRGVKEVRQEIPGGITQVVRISYLTDSHGEHIGHVEIALDVTEQERLRREAADAECRARQSVAEQLETVMSSLDNATHALFSTINTATQDAQDTAQRMSEASTAMNQMMSTVQEVAHNAAEAASGTEGVLQKANEGEGVVEQVLSGMQGVQDTSLTLKTDMAKLDEQARNIGNILILISDIADQTNLLALNAAIEAARAGEAGRGFAVVADEVRKLAEKSVSATKDVERAVIAIQQGTSHSSDTVDAAVQAISDTTRKAQQAGQALQGIVDITAIAAVKVQAIATAAEEQSSTSEHVNNTVENTTTLSVKLSEAMNGALGAVAEMEHQAEILHKVVEDLRS